MREMLARIGEQAPGIPEAVLPLSREMFERLGLIGGGPAVTINIIEPHVRDDSDIDLMGDKLISRLRLRGVKI